MQDRLPKRDEVPVELTWRLEDIYENEDKWEEELKKIGEVADKIASFEGKLANNNKQKQHSDTIFKTAGGSPQKFLINSVAVITFI